MQHAERRSSVTLIVNRVAPTRQRKCRVGQLVPFLGSKLGHETQALSSACHWPGLVIKKIATLLAAIENDALDASALIFSPVAGKTAIALAAAALITTRSSPVVSWVEGSCTESAAVTTVVTRLIPSRRGVPA